MQLQTDAGVLEDAIVERSYQKLSQGFGVGIVWTSFGWQGLISPPPPPLLCYKGSIAKTAVPILQLCSQGWTSHRSRQCCPSTLPTTCTRPRYYGALCRGPTCRWQLCCCRLLRPHQALGIGAGHNFFFTRRSSGTHTVRNRSFQLRLSLLHAWVLGF